MKAVDTICHAMPRHATAAARAASGRPTHPLLLRWRLLSVICCRRSFCVQHRLVHAVPLVAFVLTVQRVCCGQIVRSQWCTYHRCRSHVVLYATLYADVRAHIDRAVRRVRHAVNDDLRANGVHERADAANEPLGQCSAMFSEVNEQRTIDRMQLSQYSGE